MSLWTGKNIFRTIYIVENWSFNPIQTGTRLKSSCDRFPTRSRRSPKGFPPLVSPPAKPPGPVFSRPQLRIAKEQSIGNFGHFKLKTSERDLERITLSGLLYLRNQRCLIADKLFGRNAYEGLELFDEMRLVIIIGTGGIHPLCFT